MIERAERQIKDNGTTPLNALLPRFFHNSDCLLCPGNTNIRMNDDSNRTLVIDFLAPPSQYGFYAAAREVGFVSESSCVCVKPSSFQIVCAYKRAICQVTGIVFNNNKWKWYKILLITLA